MTQQYHTAGFRNGDVGTIPRPPMPPQNTGWAVASIVFFWPLAFSAFGHSAKVFPLWSMGDYEGAQRESDQAKKLGKLALIICAVLIVLFIVLYGLIIAVAVANVGSAPTTTYPAYR